MKKVLINTRRRTMITTRDSRVMTSWTLQKKGDGKNITRKDFKNSKKRNRAGQLGQRKLIPTQTNLNWTLKKKLGKIRRRSSEKHQPAGQREEGKVEKSELHQNQRRKAKP